MAIRNIVLDTDEVLRKKCRPVEVIDAKVLTLISDMIDTVKKADGVGLAAPQVGVLKRIFVINDPAKKKVYEIINPEIVATSGTQQTAEGCLSVPGKYGVTNRPMKVTIRGIDRNGKKVEYTEEGLIAKAFCHETDHLDGILYTDKVIRMLSPEELEN
ncbi:MAG: peptide deformylase [Ruminococcaceae bacterium]|nr:peptide deformylase [Oscillospiraceae bacterium]